MNKSTLFTAALLMAGSISAHAANSDELWEITNVMEMNGMSIPSATQKSCLPKNRAYDPEAADKNCTAYDVKVSGNKTSWKMRCTGKDAMEGSGVMTKTATSLDGMMTMKSQGEQMTMKMSGRVVGKCDSAAEQKRLNAMVADAQSRQANALAQSEDLQRKSCEDTRKTVSTRFDSYDSYKQAESGNPEIRAYLAKCKVDLEASRNQLCQKATFPEHEFVKKYCPDEYAAMKLQHCVGRSSSFRDLCDGTPGNSEMGTAATSITDNPTKAILDGAKGLMNVFGF